MAVRYARYNPQGMNMLMAAVVRQAYRDATMRHTEGMFISGATRREARYWWHECAAVWVETLGLEVELPNVPRPFEKEAGE